MVNVPTADGLASTAVERAARLSAIRASVASEAEKEWAARVRGDQVKVSAVRMAEKWQAVVERAEASARLAEMRATFADEEVAASVARARAAEAAEQEAVERATRARAAEVAAVQRAAAERAAATCAKQRAVAERAAAQERLAQMSMMETSDVTALPTEAGSNGGGGDTDAETASLASTADLTSLADLDEDENTAGGGAVRQPDPCWAEQVDQEQVAPKQEDPEQDVADWFVSAVIEEALILSYAELLAHQVERKISKTQVRQRATDAADSLEHALGCDDVHSGDVGAMLRDALIRAWEAQRAMATVGLVEEEAQLTQELIERASVKLGVCLTASLRALLETPLPDADSEELQRLLAEARTATGVDSDLVANAEGVREILCQRDETIFRLLSHLGAEEDTAEWVAELEEILTFSGILVPAVWVIPQDLLARAETSLGHGRERERIRQEAEVERLEKVAREEMAR